MKRFIPYYLLLMTAMLAGCMEKESASPQISPVKKQSKDTTELLVKSIQGQSRLFTAEYHIHKIVTHEDLLKLKGNVMGIEFEHRFHIGERKIAIPIEVTLKACVDFSTFSARQVERYGNIMHIILPDPEIILTSSKVDHEGVKQFKSIWRQAYSDEEMADFTKQGVESILEQVPAMRLMHTARECAAQTLIPLLTSLGYEEDHVIITFREGYKPERLDILDKLGKLEKLDRKNRKDEIH